MSEELTNEYLEKHRVTLENLLGQHPKYVDHVRKSTQRELALIDEVLRLRAELDGFKGLWEVVCRDRDDVQDQLTAATARAEKAERERDEAVSLMKDESQYGNSTDYAQWADRKRAFYSRLATLTAPPTAATPAEGGE